MINFTLKRLFSIIVLLEIILMILIVFFLMKKISISRKLSFSERNKFFMNQAAVKLKQSSDDLTRFARLYTVTGEKKYLDNYNTVLGIRNGERPRPKDYDKIYWDYVKPCNVKIHPPESKKSFVSIIDSLPCNDEERNLILMSLEQSNDIVEIEYKAMTMINRFVKSNPGPYGYIKTSGQNQAIRLLFGEKYLRKKEGIMEPLDLFMISMNKRTQSNINSLKRDILIYGDIFKFVLGCFIVYNLFLLFLFHRKVICIIVCITDRIKSFVNLDPSEKRKIICRNSNEGDELGMLINEFNHLHSEISERTEMLEQSYQKVLEQRSVIDRYVIFSETDIDGTIIYASDAFCKISGYSRDELLGQSHRLIRHPDTTEEVYSDIEETLSAGGVWKGQLKHMNKNGNGYWVDVVIEPVYNRRDQIAGYRSIRIDIEDKKRIEYLSITDKLTGLYNRLKLDEVFQREMERSKRYGNCFSVILLDVDKFKNVNDTYGHQDGDLVLRSIALILKDNVRVVDTVGRWGGEEFLILCPETERDQAFVIAEKLRKMIESFSFPEVGLSTASFGITSCLKTDTKESIMKRVDEALYKSKEEGRNRVYYLD